MTWNRAVMVVVGVCVMAVASYGIERDSEALTEFLADFRAVELQNPMPGALRQMSGRYQELSLLDQVKALLSLASVSQAPTFFGEWFALVEKAPDAVDTLLFVTRSLDPDHDREYDGLLEQVATIAMDLINNGRLSVQQSHELRATFEGQITSALANNFRALTIGLVIAHTVIDTLDGYPVPVMFLGSRDYYMHIYNKYSAMGIELISPQDRGQYRSLK